MKYKIPGSKMVERDSGSRGSLHFALGCDGGVFPPGAGGKGDDSRFPYMMPCVTQDKVRSGPSPNTPRGRAASQQPRHVKLGDPCGQRGRAGGRRAPINSTKRPQMAIPCETVATEGREQHCPPIAWRRRDPGSLPSSPGRRPTPAPENSDSQRPTPCQCGVPTGPRRDTQ